MVNMTRTFNKYTWLIRGIVVVSVLWISAGIRLWQLRHRMENLWVQEIGLRVVDATSGAAIPPEIGLPGDSGDHLPVGIAHDVTKEFGKYTIVADKPVFFQILSEGYAGQWIKVDNNSPIDIIVKLAKNAAE